MFHCKIFQKTKVHQRIYSTNTKNDFEPKTTRRIFLPNPDKKRIIASNNYEQGPPVFAKVYEKKIGPRKNHLDIQMLCKALYDQVFKERRKVSIDMEMVTQCMLNLGKHKMVTKEEDYVKDVNFQLPPILGKDLLEHFKIIGEEQAHPYRESALHLIKGIPAAPETWEMRVGWTRYAKNQKPVSVPYPLEECVIFDVEVCMAAGKVPTLATAVSSEAWYGWVSQALVDAKSAPVTVHQYHLDQLIPFESTLGETAAKLNEHMKKPKVIIGHNVSYDRARIKEQYWPNRTGTRFIDTMSLHICVSGVTSYQRTVLKSGSTKEEHEDWTGFSSLNNLSDVHNLYCGSKLSKDVRDLFVTGTISDIHSEFSNVMNYCSSDVVATHNVMKVLFPMFLERFPHPVTLAGMLELGTAYLPINNNWNRYIDDSQQTYDDLDIEGRLYLARRADQACQLMHDEKYKDDIWMWDQDWETKHIKMKKAVVKKSKKNPELVMDKPLVRKKKGDEEEPDPLEEKFQYLWDLKENLPSVETALPGYPNWYRKLCTKPNSPDWVPGPHLISTSMKITPKLLALTWEGYPLHHIREKGWGFLVPFSDDTDIHHNLPLHKLLERCPLLTDKPKKGDGDKEMEHISQTVQDNLMRKEFYSKAKADKTEGLYKGTGIWCNEEVENCCFFMKLPHKNGAAYNVGNPLSKDFLNKFSENVLAGDTDYAEHVLRIARSLSYWRNNRDRIMDQMVGWIDDEDLPPFLQNQGHLYGAIVPQVVVCGTLTRRAMEPTWMTASNANAERIGSELRAMIQAPKGYAMVGADVDSQELWIASVLGDAQYAKMHGATPFGWMTLSGNKSDGTDMHSVTAKAVGISRDHAKVINYARIYGAGQNFAERLLKQFNPSISDAEAKQKALKMFTLTKGKRIFHLRKEFIHDFPDQAYSKWQAFQIAKTMGKSVDEVFHNPKWVGGTESAMFNRLEEIANSNKPCTPFLEGRLSRSLEPRSKDDKFLPTRVNWVVQSGAVDFLHLMLVCMRWIMKDRIRFCLSFHDEIRYLVPEEHKYTAALAMHVTNLLTRSFCALKLGLNDLPQSVAFFSSVEIDTVLRKESKHDCVTPSNPHGLEKGYGISNGESLDIYEAIQKAGGHYSAWYKRHVTSHEEEARPKRDSPR